MEFAPYIAISIFGISLLAIIFEVVDKAVVSLLGALAFVVLGIIAPKAALGSIEFETLFLLLGMMMLVEIARRSGVFEWLNVRVARYTKGNPLLILILFVIITFLFSAFLDNVTTILIVVPVTIALTQGMGLDPKMYVIAEILFSNIGGALTLIGDPVNILVGGSAKLSFNAFLVNLSAPIFIAAILILLSLILLNWKQFSPIKGNLQKLFLSSLLIRKIQYKFLQVDLNKKFILKVLFILFATLLGFVLHGVFHFEPYVIALLGATALLLATTKESSIHEALEGVEWPTLIFFAGLFVMVGGLKSVGVLELASDFIVHLTNDYFTLLLIVLWMTAFVSMVLDNIPFVAVMIPVISQIQSQFVAQPDVDLSLLWWALSMGAVFGGCGTMIGASANVVGIGAARKLGVRISFMDFTKVGFPVAMLALTVASVYFYFRVHVL